VIARVLAWLAVIFGAAITLESTLIAHRPNWIWILILVLGIAYFLKNGFLRSKPPTSGGAG
jgi:hypothetical protein